MDNNLKEHLKAREQSHLDLNVRKSSAALDEILADDFWEIGSSGRMFDKKECLDSGVSIAEMTMYNFEIQPLAPDVVLSTYFIENHTRKRNTLRSSIWKYIDGRWQLYFHQGTITNLQADGVIHSYRKEGK
ncbi:DUF4440 domain-containing protein [Halobacillus sp. A5]|uniref:nuclear transport factor 2 family protein n=1 Tax=Halobacillus sp. A5 TaxID=2880263 RepID=UPI0020A67879|nr:DUF4440 domain-containing protein [Halobacillus sp. A5]MCP3028451.1 DUF4440 domain-containing protein [Halobacillus sp. A5]